MKTKKLVYGVGNNNANYVVVEYEITVIGGKRRQKLVWLCPYYRTWKSMLARCYSTKLQERNPTYVGCVVSDEWLTFSVFRAWMTTQDWKRMQLDKDLLIEGNKIYSPETCVFVSGAVNKFTTDRGAARGEFLIARGEFLIGVCWDNGRNKFKSQCRNPFTKKQEHLGYFNCELEAHEKWAKRKLELAHDLAAIQPDPRVAKALINRYSQYQKHSENTVK